MNKENRLSRILLADDDADDRMLAKEALTESNLKIELDMVEDGEELMDYLNRRGKFKQLKKKSLPGLILLDLNMPRKNGHEALREIKSDPCLCHIPVVVLTTCQTQEEVYRSYNLGVNSFITKPVTFNSFVELMQNLSKYWFEVVSLPTGFKDV